MVKELNSNFNKYKEAILGPDLSDRRNLINKLMKTETVQDAIRKESIDNKISMFEAENRAKGYLTEVVSDFSYSTLRFAELALTKESDATAANGRATQAMKNIVVGEKNRQQPGSLHTPSTR